MATSTAQLTGRAAYQWGALTLLGATAIILVALGFEYLGGFEPCPLCIQQRYAYYAGIPLLFAALILFTAGRRGWAAAIFFLVSLGFLANAGLGVYHAGVEWRFWEGPATCSGGLKPLTTSGSSLLQDLGTKSVALCGEAQGRVLGLSFAGWNVIASIGLMLGALKAAIAARAND